MPVSTSTLLNGHQPQPNESPTLVEALLSEQCRLTAVEVFSRAHDAGEVRARRYRDLLPVTAPASGQQYAFEVNLDKCSGCKACVTACHSLNGLDEGETWRSVGALISKDWRAPLQQTVTTACHHCVDPGCLNGCPVLAYDKDPVTGIVRHLDDQCIGCQYCVMKCPYEVPQYSAKRGIVRKCDMCANRLAVGEAPACVQACPNEAIKITVVEQDNTRGKYRGLPTLNLTNGTAKPPAANTFLPSSPNPAITVPTTRYVSRRPLAATLQAGDAHDVPIGHAHPPLTFMLVLTQLGVGLTVFDALIRGPSRVPAVAAMVATLAGVGLGTLHLGQPLKAWRGFLGWRKSWLSRELIAFGGFIQALAVHVVLQLPITAMTAVISGLVAVFCSAMLYVDTRRPFWKRSYTFGKFLGSTLLLGGAGGFVLSTLGHAPPVSSQLLIAAIIAGAVFKLALENQITRHWVKDELRPLDALNRSARLLVGPLGLLSRLRRLCLFAGGVVLPVLVLGGLGGVKTVVTMFAVALAGEFIERHLFFVAEAAPKMPGGGTE